jgi:hypothetical protein
MTQLSTTAINLSDESMQLTVSDRRRLPLDASALRRLADRAAAANTVAARVRAGCTTSGLLPGPRSGPLRYCCRSTSTERLSSFSSGGSNVRVGMPSLPTLGFASGRPGGKGRAGES